MDQREKLSIRVGERTAAACSRDASRARLAGLAVEGPGFFVWDEVASVARNTAGELWAVVPWELRSARTT
jgi:hypothetical protein